MSELENVNVIEDEEEYLDAFLDTVFNKFNVTHYEPDSFRSGGYYIETEFYSDLGENIYETIQLNDLTIDSFMDGLNELVENIEDSRNELLGIYIREKPRGTENFTVKELVEDNEAIIQTWKDILNTAEKVQKGLPYSLQENAHQIGYNLQYASCDEEIIETYNKIVAQRDDKEQFPIISRRFDFNKVFADKEPIEIAQITSNKEFDLEQDYFSYLENDNEQILKSANTLTDLLEDIDYGVATEVGKTVRENYEQRRLQEQMMANDSQL